MWKESLRETLNFGHPDEICQFEWGYWPETLERWRSEGMEDDIEPWDAVGITTYERVPVNTRFYPPFEIRILEETGECVIRQNEDGVIERVFKNRTSMPEFIKYPVECLRDFEALKERLDPESPGRFPSDWESAVEELKTRDTILVLGHVEVSFFGWHRDLMGIENLCYALVNDPELIHAISRHHVDFLKRLYSKIASDVQYDFVFMWEDMCYKNGPLISPEMVREFMLPYYKDLIGFFKDMGDYKVLVDSDGDVRKLIPLLLEGGIDGMLPFECQAGMDIVSIRKEFPDLIICGGIDKRMIARGREAIDRELEAKLPFMFKQGGYLPSMDHHVPPEVSYDDFRYYVDKVRSLYKRYR